jgi:hypothetical protein
MSKHGYHDGTARANSYPICSPPIRPPASQPRSATTGKNGTVALPEREPQNLTIELGQASLDRLARLETALDNVTITLNQIQEQQGTITATLTELRDSIGIQRKIKEWYSPEEVAKILGKQPYTVREWCRYQRINARKRPTGRGDAREWEISHEELDRIKSHGLLPIPTKY